MPPIAPIANLLQDAVELMPGSIVRLCNPLVHTNAGDLSPDFWRRQFWRNAALHEPQAPVTFGRYAEADVTGTGPHILMSQGSIAAEYIPTNYGPDDLARRIAEMRAAQDNPIVVEEPCVYAAFPGLRIWGHWLLEMLPCIVLIERRWPGLVRYVLPHDLAPEADRFFNRQVGESLAAYGVTPDRILPIHGGRLYRFRNLRDVTSMSGQGQGLHPASFNLPDIPALSLPGWRLGITAVLRSGYEACGLSKRRHTRLLQRWLDPPVLATTVTGESGRARLNNTCCSLFFCLATSGRRFFACVGSMKR